MENIEYDGVVRKRNEEWERLEQAIKDLVKERYRLMDKVVYEPLEETVGNMIGTEQRRKAGLS